ncbi:hypothetical protein [Natronorubrum sp. DTA7]|uniref:hypothetical protein n=1 Tax=Natronorubrum sp. DTA7 TaxID=3447016 RepID=UPI003F825743
MYMSPQRRAQSRALALAAMLVVSLFALTVVPTGLGAEPTSIDTDQSATTAALESSITTTDTDEDIDDFEGDGDPVELDVDDTEYFHYDGEEHGDLYYLIGDLNEQVYVYDEDFTLLETHALEYDPAGITRFDGQWVISSWDTDQLYIYDDDAFEDPETVDLADHDVGGVSTTPWNIDSSDGQLYVTDHEEIVAFDADYEVTDRIQTDLETAKGLHAIDDRLFLMDSDTDPTVYEYDLDGNEVATYDAPPDYGDTYDESTKGLMLLGGDWYVHPSDLDSNLYRFPATVEESTSATLSGVVTDQRGEPVPNATVTAHGISETAFPDLDGTALESEADDLLAELEDPLPDAFDESYDLDAHTDTDSTYALIHESNDWGVGTNTIIESSIDDPRVTVDDNQQVVISLWDPAEDGGWIENQVDQSFYGATTEGTVVIEQLSPTGEITDTRTLETEPIASTTGANPLSTTEHHGVRTTLPPGVYRAFPEDNDAGGYPFTVGSPDEIASGFADDLRDDADQLTERAERIADLEADETLVRETTQADANGEFELEIDETVATATVQPLGTPGDTLQTLETLEEPTVADLQALDHDGAFYLPTPTAQTYAPPEDDLELTVYRTPDLPFAELEAYEDLHAELEDALLNQNLSELDGWDEHLAEMDHERRGELEDAFGDLLEGSEDELENGDDPDLETILDRLDDLENTIDVGGGVIDESDQEFDISWTLPDDITDEVTIVAHTDAGETHTVDDEYWTLESGGLFDDPTVTLEEHPFDDQTAVANYEIHIADGVSYGSDSVSAPNPAFDGEIPDLETLSFSTLSPAAGERVSLDVRTAADSTADVIDADVIGPDDETITAEIDATDDRVAFEATGDGVHHVRLTLESASGHEFTVTERLHASDRALPDHATVRAGTSAVGDYAVTGDTLTDARLKTDGDSIDVTAVIDPDENLGELHVQPDPVLSGNDHEFDISIVEGPDEMPVNSNVAVTVHLENYDPDSAVHWRNSDAITVDGDTRYGEVLTRNDGEKHLLMTYTDGNGELESLEITEDAGWTDRVWHRLDRSIPTITWLPTIGNALLVVVETVLTVAAESATITPR